MKTTFGNTLTRFLWNGVSLYPVEQVVLQSVVESLPAPIKEPLLAQLNAFNLVQREVDGRALNFYRKRSGSVSRDGLSDLPIKSGEVLLVKVTFATVSDDESIHVTATAIDKQFFCLSFSRDLRPYAQALVSVLEVTPSWRSNIVGAQQSAPGDGSPAASRA